MGFDILGMVEDVTKRATGQEPQRRKDTSGANQQITYKLSGRGLDDTQVRTESNFKQFDKAGKPLVGRYRDGTTPKKGSEAYGVGQIQIGTARDTAKRHGIPWSEGKLLNDPNYNLMLADRHMEDLMDKYGGDRTLARAAYHSGAGTVDKAIAKYGRQNFAQGLGPHGRDYIRMGDKGKASANGSGVMGFLNDLSGTPEARASNSTSNTGAVFGSDATLAKNFDAVRANQRETSDKIDVLSEATNALHEVQTQQMQQQVQDTRAISDQITEGTEALKRTVTPVFAARQRVNDQLDKIATMNPLVRGFKAVFDLNYDKRHLEGQLDAFDRTLKARGADFEYMNHLHQVAMQEIDRRYSMNTALPSLAVAQSKEDLGVLGVQLANLNGVLETNMGEIRSQVQVVQAKQAARGDLLERTDSNTITDLANQAQANGGTVEYQGMDFSYRELYEMGQNREKQALAMESHRMAVESGRMDIAEKHAVNVIQTMTKSQLEGAIQNDGMFNGMQLPQDHLTAAYNSMIGRENLQAEEMINSQPLAQLGSAIQQQTEADVALFKRGRAFFGDQENRAFQQNFTNVTALSRQFTEAVKAGANNKVLQAIAAKIQVESKAMRKTVDASILRSAGGDKRSAGYITSFVYGTPVNAGTAMEAITYFAIKGGMPEGMMASPESRQLFESAMNIVAKNRTDTDGKPRSQAALEQIVTRELGDTVFRTVGAARFDRIWQSLPELAKKAGNPLGKLDPTQWGQVLSDSEADADLAVATPLNTSKDIVRKMRVNSKPISGSEADKQLYANYQKVRDRRNAVEASAIIRRIDELGAIQPGTDNSELLIGFLRSSELQGQIKTITQSNGANSFGDFFVNPLSAGSTEKNISAQAGMLTNARSDNTQANREQARRYDSAWGQSPMARAQFILTSIPGVGKDGAQALLPYLKESPVMSLGNQVRHGSMTALSAVDPTFSTNMTVIQEQEAMMKAALMSTKFDDPRAEAFRKAAVRGWDDSATEAAGYMERLLDALKP